MDVLTNLVRSKAPTVLFLMETKWSIAEMRKICDDLNFQSVFAVPSDGRSDGLGMFWKATVTFTYKLSLLTILMHIF